MYTSDQSFSVARALLASAATETEKAKAPEQPPFTITLSREAGARANSIARELGQRLDWPVHDQEILARIAEEVKQPAFYFRELDERPIDWLEGIFAGLASDHHLSPSAYLKYLIGVVRGLGKMGHCIIVGRGANHILPAPSTLRVRLVAPLADRIRYIAAQRGVTEDEAKRWIEVTQRARIDFVKSHFGCDPTDVQHYDLVLNTGRVGDADAARIIVEMLRILEARPQKQNREAGTQLAGASD